MASRGSIDTSQLNQLAIDLGKAGAKVSGLAQTAVTKTAYDLESDAKVFCPVDTGNLRNSISTSIGVLSAEIGPTAEYGAYVEFGTSRQAPAAYMGPAFDRRAGDLERAAVAIVDGIL